VGGFGVPCNRALGFVDPWIHDVRLAERRRVVQRARPGAPYVLHAAVRRSGPQPVAVEHRAHLCGGLVVQTRQLDFPVANRRDGGQRAVDVLVHEIPHGIELQSELA